MSIILFLEMQLADRPADRVKMLHNPIFFSRAINKVYILLYLEISLGWFWGKCDSFEITQNANFTKNYAKFVH